MAKTKFNDSWYVRKDRINLFAPLEQDYAIEISRVDGASLDGSVNNRFIDTISGNSDTKDICSGLNFTENETASSVVTCNKVLTSMLNQAFYGRKQTTTLAFWTRNIDNNITDSVNIGTMTRMYVTNNCILGDDIKYGYAFHTFAHTTTLSISDQYSHLLNLNGMQKVNNSYITELSTEGTNNFTTPAEVWALNVFVMEHYEGDVSSKCTIHILYNDNDGNFNHYWAVNNSLDPSTIGTRTNTTDNLWTLGGCQGITTAGNNENQNVIQYGHLYEGKLRNLMLYNVVLTFDEITTLFNHGINPYEASDDKNTDVDSFDRNFWGKYGVIAGNSNVKFEKCIIGSVAEELSTSDIKDLFSTKLNIDQNNGRFDISGRDGSHLEVINRGNTKLDDGEVSSYSNYSVDDPTTALRTQEAGYNVMETDLLSVGVWRNSFATGNGKIRFVKPTKHGSGDDTTYTYETVSKAIGGSFIEGGTDMIKVSPDVNPETLPSGRYVTEWVVNKPNNTNYPGYNPQTGLSSFLPNYYLRDRLGRSYKGFDLQTSIDKDVASVSAKSTTNVTDSKYVNGAFWGNTARYERILWTRPRNFASDITDDQFLNKTESERIDLCSAWEPVFWGKAVYEINNEPKISSKGYFSTIRLILINEDMSKSAVYYKLGKPTETNSGNVHIQYGDWQFDSFNSINNIKDKERLARIFLPHIIIPKLGIPIATVNVTKASGVTGQQGSFANSDIVAVKAGTGRPSGKESKTPISGGKSIIYTSIINNQNGYSGDPSGNPSYQTFDWSHDSWPKYYAASTTGWYEFTWHFSYYVGDNNDIVQGIINIKNPNNNFGGDIVAQGFVADYVRGSKGGAYASDTLKAFVFMQKGAIAKILAKYNNNTGGVSWFTIRRMSGNNVVTDVDVSQNAMNPNATINNVLPNVKGDSTNGYYYEWTNVPAKYVNGVSGVIDVTPYME